MTDGADELAGTAWRLIRIGRKPTLPDPQVTAEFSAEGRVAGSAGCNRYFGPYTVDGSALSLGPLGSTMMMCAPDIFRQEARFLAILQASTNWRRTKGRLRMSGGAVSLTFEPS